MSKNIYEIVEEKLKENDNYVAEDGKLLKAKVYSDVMTMNKDLIKLLLSDEKIKDTFFVKIDDTEVFDKQKFAWFIESKEFLPDSYTKYTNRIGLTSNCKFISQNNDVVLDFPYKDCKLEFDSTDENEKRNEKFYNDIIAKDEITRMLEPKIFSNIKKYCKKNENDKINSNDNLIIKGNNLIALYSLLPRYDNKIKFMYWDILYNTNSDLVPYNDSFKHSSWLVMMKNRLEVAKELLNNDTGVIAIECDDNEQAYLKVLCDEIFDRNNFICMLVIETGDVFGSKASHIDKTFVKVKDYILLYARNKQNIRINPLYQKMSIPYDTHYNSVIINDKKTPLLDYLNNQNKIKAIFDSYRLKINMENINKLMQIDKTFKNYVNDELSNIVYCDSPFTQNVDNIDKMTPNKIYNISGHKVFKTTGGNLRFYIPLSKTLHESDDFDCEYTRCSYRGDLWKNFVKDMANVSKEGKVDLKNGKKPERLLRDLIYAFTNENDIVLDAYLGTGTTCAVAQKMNRKYIGIEQLDEHIKLTLNRMINVVNGTDNSGISKKYHWKGGGSFVYCELKENGKELISKIQSANENNINDIKELIYNDDRIVSYITKQELKNTDDLFNEMNLNDKKKALINLVDKNKLYVNYSDIDDESYNISEEEKKFNKSFYEGE